MLDVDHETRSLPALQASLDPTAVQLDIVDSKTSVTMLIGSSDCLPRMNESRNEIQRLEDSSLLTGQPSPDLPLDISQDVSRIPVHNIEIKKQNDFWQNMAAKGYKKTMLLALQDAVDPADVLAQAAPESSTCSAAKSAEQIKEVDGLRGGDVGQASMLSGTQLQRHCKPHSVASAVTSTFIQLAHKCLVKKPASACSLVQTDPTPKQGGDRGFSMQRPDYEESKPHRLEGQVSISRCSFNSGLCEPSGSSRTKSSWKSNIDLPAGTGVYYTAIRSSSSTDPKSTDYSIQRLSLLADVSCKLRCRHQISRELASLTSDSLKYKYIANQRLRKFVPTTLETTVKIVKKLRTPRRTWVQHPDSSRSHERRTLPDDKYLCFGPDANKSNSAFRQKQSENHVTVPVTADISTKILSMKRKSREGLSNPSCQTVTTTEIDQPAQNRNIVKISRSSSKVEEGRKRRGKETRAHRYASRILQFVGERSISEKLIRAALGNNPDTSKALRLLLAEHRLKRNGDGGRGKAYVYVATTKGLHEFHELEQAGEKPVCAPEQTPYSECAT